jgi:signal transduction histidine kinase
MVACFISVHNVTRIELQRQNLQNLARLAAQNNSANTVFATPGAGVDDSRSVSNLLSFSINVRQNNQVLSFSSPFELSEKTCAEALEKVTATGSSELCIIELDGKRWQYVFSQPPEKYSEYTITFLDVTGSRNLLIMLRIILIFVGIVMMGAIFAISLFFAHRSITPVADAWKKQQQFIADASHELKTPLAVIQANYDVIASNPDETVREQMKWMEYMKAGMDRMTLLVRDMLSLATLESGSLQVKKELFDMSVRILRIIHTMKASVDEKLIEVSARIEPDIKVYSDVEIVARIFTTFYENAIKYTAPYGRIYVALSFVKRNAVCSVSNTGDGIPQEDLPNVFDRFYRSDSSRNRQNGGFGLGLTIAKKNIEMLGGKVNVSCDEDRITTFTFTLPRN